MPKIPCFVVSKYHRHDVMARMAG